MQMSQYTWIVSQGQIVGDSSGSVGHIGPPHAKNRARFDIVIKSGQRFRLLDADGNMRYLGYIYGEYEGREPLEEYGRGKGCVAIEYERDGRWVRLD